MVLCNNCCRTAMRTVLCLGCGWKSSDVCLSAQRKEVFLHEHQIFVLITLILIFVAEQRSKESGSFDNPSCARILSRAYRGAVLISKAYCAAVGLVSKQNWLLAW